MDIGYWIYFGVMPLALLVMGHITRNEEDDVDRIGAVVVGIIFWPLGLGITIGFYTLKGLNVMLKEIFPPTRN